MANTFEDLVISLFGSVFSIINNDVKTSITDSIYKLGCKKPAVVLSAAHTYLIQNNKLTHQHRAIVLNTIMKIIQKSTVVDLLEEQQVLLIINLATQEMTTMLKETNEICADAAKDLLVTLGKYDRFVGSVMDALLLKFPPGLSTPPNRHVILAIALISEKNPFGFVPFLTDVLSRTVPLLSHLKNDSMKSAWAQSLSMFCESLVEFSSCNKQKESDEPTQTDDQTTPALIDNDLKQNYSDQMEAVYEVVFSWIYSKDYKCRADVAECVGSLCLIISKTKINRDLKKLVTAFLSLYKKITNPSEQLALTRGVANFLELCCSDDTLPIDAYLDDIFNCLFGHVCNITEQSFTVDQSNDMSSLINMKLKNEAFRCFHVAARRFADKLVYYLLHKMQSEKDTYKLGATNLMRHLLNAAGPQMEDKQSLITMGLKPMLLDEQISVRVKMSICVLCVALADHGLIGLKTGYVESDGGGDNVVKFLMRNLIPPEDPTGNASNNAAKTSKQEVQANAQFHSQCSQALLTIAKTCESAHDLLWPYLFEFVCMDSYTPVVGDICKCLKVLIVRRKEMMHEKEDDTLLTINTDENQKLPGPHQVFARLLVCLNGASLNPSLNRRAVEIIGLMRELGPWFHASLTDVLPERLDKLSKYLEEIAAFYGDSSSSKDSNASNYSAVALRCAKTQRWQAAILDVLDSCIQSVVDGDWREKLAAALTQQLRLYVNQPQDRCFLLRVIGFTLSRVANVNFVVDHVYLAFRSANHASQNERMGCALLMETNYEIMVGKVLSNESCLQNPTTIYLLKCELYWTPIRESVLAKWEHSKKSGSSLFTYLKEATYGKSDVEEVANLRATIVLSYGYVMLYCPVDLVVQRLEKTVLPFLRQYLASFKAETVIKEAHLDTINLIATTVHPSHLNSTDYKFESRFECFSYIKQYIKSETPDLLSSWVRLLAAKATASLAKLEPSLSENETWDISNVLSRSIFPICREKSGLKTLDEYECAKELDIFTQRPPTIKTFHRSGSASSSNSLSSNSRFDSFGNNEFFNFFIEDDETSTTMEATVAQYHSAICQIVLKKPIVQTVSQLLKMFQTFYSSASGHERIRSVETTVLILQVYLNNATDTKLGHANDFPPLCSILGRLAPRLADSVSSVRNAAIRSIWLAFRLSLLHGGHSPLDTDVLDDELFGLKTFIDKYLGAEGRVDSQISRSAITAIAKEIESRLPQTQVQIYLSVLFKMVTDEQNNVGSGAAQLLAITLENRGHLLNTEAELIFKTILENLPRVHNIDMTYKNLLNSFRLFAGHQQITAVDVLLQQPLPYSIQIKDVWKELAQESSQFYLIADYLLDLFGFTFSLNESDGASNDQLSTNSHQTHTSSTNHTRKFFEIVDTGAGSSVKLVSNHLCALLAALNEIIKNGEPESAVNVRVPNFLASLFCSLTAVIDAQYPAASKEPTSTRNCVITNELCRLTTVPVNLVIETLKTLVNRLQMQSIVDTMNSARSWSQLSNIQHYLSAITIFCRSFCDCSPELTLNLMRLLLEKIKPEHVETDRIAAAAVLSSLITRCPNETGEFDLVLLRETFQSLSTALSDSNLTVKKLALRGFSCTGTLVDIYSQNEKGSELFQELADQAVHAAVSALDDSSDRNDQLSVEAVNTLESLIFVLKRQVLEEILPKLLFKIRPCFEKDNTALRIVSFSLFGKLSLRVGHSDIFRESLHSNIVSVLLHLNDADKDVRAVCAQALKNFESAFTSPHIVALVQKELSAEGVLGKYVNFLQDFSAVMAVSFPDRVNYYSLNCSNYFKSQSPVIRANAAYMVGYLIEALTPSLRQTISTNMIFSGFAQLLTDSDNDVRCAAAKAITHMSSFADDMNEQKP